MENRFFDIDSNVYLNSIYILSILNKFDGNLSIKKLLIMLYLIKNPKIFLGFLSNRQKVTFNKYIKAYEINNVQSEMIKYNSKIFTNGFNESLSFLYSKDLITYDLEYENIKKSDKFDNINFRKFPRDLMSKATYITKVISNYSESELELKINDLWEVLYE